MKRLANVFILELRLKDFGPEGEDVRTKRIIAANFGDALDFARSMIETGDCKEILSIERSIRCEIVSYDESEAST